MNRETVDMKPPAVVRSMAGLLSEEQDGATDRNEETPFTNIKLRLNELVWEAGPAKATIDECEECACKCLESMCDLYAKVNARLKK